VIRSIRHKRLKRLYEDDDPRGVFAEYVEKLRRILARPEAAEVVTDMDIPGYRLHALEGELHGSYAVTVSANWCLVFRFEHGDALDVDYVDYH